MNKSKIKSGQPGTEADSNSTAQNKHVSQPNANTNVVRSPFCVEPNTVSILLSYDKIILAFGLRCYNDGLYDGQANLKGGESIQDKFYKFLKSINK